MTPADEIPPDDIPPDERLVPPADEPPFEVPFHEFEGPPKTGKNFKSLSYQGESAKSLWLVSFSDLVALMLAFFVLMYSMSSPREEKWAAMSSSLEQNLGDTTGGEYKGSQWNAGPSETIALQAANYGRALDMKYLNTVLADSLKNDSRLEKVILRKSRDQLVMALPEDALFDAKTGRVSENGELVLAALADLLNKLENRIEVTGNVDGASARRNRQNGWKAGMDRAAQVAASLEKEGYERPVMIQSAYQAQADSPGETAIVITSDNGREQQSLQFDTGNPP